MPEVILDQVAQCLRHIGDLQVGVFDHLIERSLTVIHQALDQAVTRATETMQGGLADARGFGQIFQRRPRAIDDGNSQGLEQFFIIGHRRPSA